MKDFRILKRTDGESLEISSFPSLSFLSFLAPSPSIFFFYSKFLTINFITTNGKLLEEVLSLQKRGDEIEFSLTRHAVADRS